MEQRRGCELSEATLGSLAGFSEHFRELFGDKRLYEGFVGTLQGILAAGTVIISRIARFSPLARGHATR
jgi:hypothetical protein